MTNRRYIAGRAYEYRVAKKLREEGWTVLRTAGSHGEFDLVAIRITRVARNIKPIFHYDGRFSHAEGSLPNVEGDIKLIQCKSGKSAKRAIKAVVDSDIRRWNGLYSVSVEVI